MTDWRKKIEDKRNEELRKERDEAARRRANAEAQKEAYQQKQEEKWKAEYAKRLAKLQARFKCHICNKPASTPNKREVSNGGGVVHYHEFYSGPRGYGKIKVDDWNLPGDLFRCENCRKWTCSDHIHWGICRKCAEK